LDIDWLGDCKLQEAEEKHRKKGHVEKHLGGVGGVMK
jgi:hypothetical protein